MLDRLRRARRLRPREPARCTCWSRAPIAERRQVLAAIGPFWDGNEVWLLATGGVLFVAFPSVLASGLSGFYFAIILVLWMLILRGISIEFRSHVEHPLWRAAWDFIFAAASPCCRCLFGAALGNLVRGLPLDHDGWFSLALFTDFTTQPPVGILDWYTVLSGVFALLAIAGHGATFLAVEDRRAVRSAKPPRSAAGRRTRSRPVASLLTLVTWRVNAPMLAALPSRPLAWLSVLSPWAALLACAARPARRPALSRVPRVQRLRGGHAGGTAACVFP